MLDAFVSDDVDDDGVEGGAFFGHENFGDGVSVEGVGGESVDGFCGESYKLSFFYYLGSFLYLV